MKRACFFSLPLLLTTTFLLSQSNPVHLPVLAQSNAAPGTSCDIGSEGASGHSPCGTARLARKTRWHRLKWRADSSGNTTVSGEMFCYGDDYASISFNSDIISASGDTPNDPFAGGVPEEPVIELYCSVDFESDLGAWGSIGGQSTSQVFGSADTDVYCTLATNACSGTVSGGVTLYPQNYEDWGDLPSIGSRLASPAALQARWSGLFPMAMFTLAFSARIFR